MIILGLDYEANSLDVKKAAMAEIGLALWDTDLGLPIKLEGHLVKDAKSPIYGDWRITEEHCNISGDMIEKHGIAAEDAITIIFDYACQCDYILAANGNCFDKPLTDHFFKRYGLEAQIPDKEWLDLIRDVPFPKKCSSKNLTYLAAFHGFVNPFPHRALTDVLTMLRVFGEYPIEDIVKLKFSPKLSIIANVDYHHRNQASERGFAWLDAPYKQWVKVICDCDLESMSPELDTYPFRYDIVEGNLVEQHAASKNKK